MNHKNKEKTALLKELIELLKDVVHQWDILDAKPAKETAFQGIARKYFHAMWPHDGYLTRDWGSILNGDINKVRLARLKPVFNATLDLTTSVTQTKFCDCFARIQDLKETSNEH